jgi:hypothetical protein
VPPVARSPWFGREPVSHVARIIQQIGLFDPK